MSESTLTEKGQTTVPKKIRQILGIKAHDRLIWDLGSDGNITVKKELSALELFGSLRPTTEFPGRDEERMAVQRITAELAAKEGLEPGG